MTPSGDMPDAASQEETFTLANVVPQNACSNEVLWEGIESAVRDLAEQRGKIFIVTGPVFKGEQLESLKGRVLVPTHLFKAVYLPSRNLAAAYWSPNDASGTWEAISIAELEKRTGINAFPGIAQDIKEKVVGVPEPVSHYHCRLERAEGPTHGRYGAPYERSYQDEFAP
jgi:endonuclease G, mitochondrial